MANREILTLVSLTALTLVSIAALVLSPSAAGADADAAHQLGPNHVPGEKLDSGLGSLRPEWPDAKQPSVPLREPGGSPAQIGHRVPGEKLDSGLGDLPPYHRYGGPGQRWAPEKIVERASR